MRSVPRPDAMRSYRTLFSLGLQAFGWVPLHATDSISPTECSAGAQALACSGNCRIASCASNCRTRPPDGAPQSPLAKRPAGRSGFARTSICRCRLKPAGGPQRRAKRALGSVGSSVTRTSRRTSQPTQKPEAPFHSGSPDRYARMCGAHIAPTNMSSTRIHFCLASAPLGADQLRLNRGMNAPPRFARLHSGQGSVRQDRRGIESSSRQGPPSGLDRHGRRARARCGG